MNPADLTVQPLGGHHDRAAFQCGEASLDQYIHQRAGQDERSGAARTFVVVRPDEPSNILAFFTLSAHSVVRSEFPEGAVRRVVYTEVPAILLGRLGVDHHAHGRRLGAYALGAAVKRANDAALGIGVRVLIVDALHEQAARFYAHFGFTRMLNRSDPDRPSVRLFLNLDHLRK